MRIRNIYPLFWCRMRRSVNLTCFRMRHPSFGCAVFCASIQRHLISVVKVVDIDFFIPSWHRVPPIRNSFQGVDWNVYFQMQPVRAHNFSRISSFLQNKIGEIAVFTASGAHISKTADENVQHIPTFSMENEAIRGSNMLSDATGAPDNEVYLLPYENSITSAAAQNKIPGNFARLGDSERFRKCNQWLLST